MSCKTYFSPFIFVSIKFSINFFSPPIKVVMRLQFGKNILSQGVISIPQFD